MEMKEGEIGADEMAEGAAPDVPSRARRRWWG